MKEFDLHVTNIFNSPPWKWIQPPTQSGRRGVNTTPLKTPAAKVGLVSYAEMRCLTTLITAGQATKVDTALDIYTKQRQATKWISTKCYSPTPMWIIVLVYIKPLYSRQISKKKKKKLHTCNPGQNSKYNPEFESSERAKNTKHWFVIY